MVDYASQLGAVTPKTKAAALEILSAAAAAGHTIKQVWGYNPASVPEHSSGKAVDFMVYSDKAAGDWIADYVWTNRERLGLRWIIWYQRIRSASPGKSGEWEPMPDRGDNTQNHKDHPHVFFDDTYTAPDGSKPPSGGILNPDGTSNADADVSADAPPGRGDIQWLTVTGQGVVAYYGNGESVVFPHAGNARYINPDADSGDVSSGVVVEDNSDADASIEITAGMIEAAVKSAGGSTSSMVASSSEIAAMFNAAIDKTMPNILNSKKRAAVLVGECAQETDWFKTTEEYGGSSTRYAPYYGRGFIQCTWKDNYLSFGRWLVSFNLIDDPNMFVNSPTLLADIKWAAYTAIWYFSKKFDTKTLWEWCDSSDSPWSEPSRAINRGSPTSPYAAYGEAARAKAINAVLAVTPEPPSKIPTAGAATAPVDDYPYKTRSWSQPDPWNFYYRECVSFCAWRIRTRTKYKAFDNSYKTHWGNAYQWIAAADRAGIPRGSTPKVGSVAVRGQGTTSFRNGHVAWVNKVYSNGTFDVEEYNHDWTNGVGHIYGTRRCKVSDFTTFIYFSD